MSDQTSVNARFTQAILEAAQRHGVQVPDVLQQALAQGARVPMAQQDMLWRLFAQATTDPLAALAVGTDLQAGHLDIVGMLLLSCDTLGEALEVLTEYAPIIGDSARFEVVSDPDAQAVVLRYLPDYSVCVDLRVEAALGCVVCLARWMTNGRFKPRSVQFAHAPRAEVAAYEALLGCPVRFGQDFHGVVIASSELGHSLIQAGKALHAHMRVLADDMLASLPQGSVSARVQQLVRRNPRWGKERIADELGISGRHLNRKLADEAISFKGLREALLYDLAVQALRSGQSVVVVGERLGFSDENAFSRAYRRWSGQTPAQFVRMEQGNG
ncbi:MAG: AraC family transcriptional regulator [Rhodoferax sp.]|nr:AraC family transcriptional regulator [Rhodoferax sp.]